MGTVSRVSPVSRGDVEVRDVSLPARDGRALAATTFLPPEPTGAVVISGAMAVPRRFYTALARFLASTGLAVTTFDFRGMGASTSGDLRREPATLTEWGTLDLPAVLDHARASSPGGALSVLGHSAGGQVLGLCDNVEHVDALLLVAGQCGDWRYWSGVGRLRMWFLWHVMLPGFVATAGRVPGGVGLGDMPLPPNVAREWARWGRTPGYLFGGDDGRARGERYTRMTAPLWALSFSDDSYAPRRAVDALVAGYPAASTSTHDHLTPGDVGHPVGHFGFFKSQSADTLWPRARAFLAHGKAAAPARSSTA